MQTVKFQFCHSFRTKMAPNLNRLLLLRHPLCHVGWKYNSVVERNIENLLLDKKRIAELRR